MFKTQYRYLVFFTLLIASGRSYGQSNYSYNLNSEKGLPSNHVYYMFKDRHGYLWISTNKGVVKYNGYKFVKFDFSNSLLKDDVWGMFEDARGRIWLSSIANGIGYIYQDKYKKAYINSKDNFIYPRYIFNHENGIKFTTIEKSPKICIENNDTIQAYSPDKRSNCVSVFMNGHGAMLYSNTKELYNIQLGEGRILVNKVCTLDKITGYYLLDNYLVPYPYKNDNVVEVIDIRDYSKKKIELEEGEYISNMRDCSEYYYLITNRKVYKLKNDLSHEYVTPFDQLISGKKLSGENVVNILEDNFWRKCVATEKNGLYINNATNHFVKKSDLNLYEYKYVGSGYDSLHYWWSKQMKRLVAIQKYKQIDFHDYSSFKNIDKILTYNNNKCLIVTDNHPYWMKPQTGDMVKFLKEETAPVIFTSYEPNQQYKIVFKNCAQFLDAFPNIIDYCSDVYIGNDSTIYLIVRTLEYLSIKFGKEIIIDRYSGYTRFKKIAGFLTDNMILMYNESEIVVYNTFTKKRVQLPDELTDLLKKIRKIEKVVIDDKYGNIFINSTNKLFAYNINDKKTQELFLNYRLDNSYLFVHRDKLILAGKFGVLFSRITGSLKFSEPMLYQNVKEANYHYIHDTQITDDSVLLNTDMGLWTVGVPTDSQLFIAKNAFTEYKLIVNYNDSIRNVYTDDTMFIDQEHKNLIFDVINPNGVGVLKYRYYMQNTNADWQDLKSDVLHLPILKAGEYHKLSIVAYDDVWQSNPVHMLLYIRPYWWQTISGIALLSIFCVFIVATMLYTTIYLTRKHTVKVHLEKNKMLSLELRSIYSQINPHFIFNTLNTGLFFIKEKRTDEAYKHIASFSQLLRSYLKSARNKFITIAEESENLRNYILLQQSRFENKFDFEIKIDRHIDKENSYLPSLLLQPLVENAITHGLLHDNKKGYLIIEYKFDKTEKKLVCIIDDNGIGRKLSKAINEENPVKNQSFGSELVKELINLLNIYEDMEIDIEYLDKSAPLTGTTVILTMKMLLYGK